MVSQRKILFFGGLFLPIIMLFMMLAHVPVANAKGLGVTDLRIGQHPDKIRIVIDIDRHTEFRAFVLAAPYRVVVDFPEFEWRAGNDINNKQKLVSGFRYGQLQSGVSRIVFDTFAPPIIQNAFILPAENNLPHRLVLDVRPGSAQEFQARQNVFFGKERLDQLRSATNTPPNLLDRPVASAAPPPPQRKTARKAPPQKQRHIIVIDPGHGGNDPGAVASNGMREKDVVLALSRELRSQLEATGRYQVIMTRDSDKFIRLHERVIIARNARADLFVSIHADSMQNRNVRGASIYTLSQTASDGEAAKLAERENRSDIIAGFDLATEQDDIADILIDLAMRDTMNQSKMFANLVVRQMENSQIRLLPRPHRYAGFAVLKAPDVPSVLVEAGFLSNSQDANMLSQRDYQQRVARALLQAIDGHFNKKAAQN